MKKKYIFLILLMIIITGCTTLNQQGIDELLPTMLNRKNNLYNVVFDGYKYYVPHGMKLENKEEYNATLLDENNQTYYFYVDAISFYNKEKLTYHTSQDAYYSKELSYQNKEGYLEIHQVGKSDTYFIEYMYNYGKIETYTTKEKINESIIEASTILSSLRFNRTVLETIIGNKVLNYKEETYNVMKPKGNVSTESYLDYEEKYGTYEGYSSKNSDEDQIEIKED